MDHEILFRGKHEGDWFYGDLLTGADTAQIWYEEEGYGKVNVLVALSTVGQYTGLTDRNGVKIFEGDILKVERTAVVKYKETKAAFFVETFDGEEEYLGEALCEEDEAEVISNIYDNPELLKGEENV